MPCVLVYREGSAIFALLRVLPDEKSETGEEDKHQAYCNYASDNHIIEEHIRPPFACARLMGEQ